ncbi:MAG TPA: peptidase, partial [Actinobacteria bacterium]|nr:peptidase [Actinomycetota bacterium]
PNSSVLDNGEAVPTTTWIDHGVLQHLIGSRSLQRSLPQARRASDNIAIDGSGTGTLNDLIARTEDALLITSLWYIREVDPQSMLLTGLTRDGVYRIRDGQIVGSAPNFRFNASPLDVMSRVTDATTNQRVQPREWGDYVFRVSAPAILSEDFNLSTRSDAR